MHLLFVLIALLWPASSPCHSISTRCACSKQRGGRMPWGGPPPYLLPPPPFSSLTWCPSDFSPSLPSLPLCFTSIPLPDYLPSHRQWIGGLHVEEDVAVPLPTNQRRATPTAVLPLSFPRCAVEAVVGNSGGHGRRHHGPVDRQPEDCKAVRMLAPWTWKDSFTCYSHPCTCLPCVCWYSLELYHFVDISHHVFVATTTSLPSSSVLPVIRHTLLLSLILFL